jgi:rhodanese-related sulfurtransferase
MKISEPGVILLDVRTDLEFAQSHLQSSMNLDVLKWLCFDGFSL